MAVTSVRPLTATGTLLWVGALLSPNCPSRLLPQATTVWSDLSAKLWLSPPAIARTPDTSPLTWTGTELLAVLLFPS